MSARWEEALDAQIDLWRFWNSDTGQKYAEGFAESLKRSKLTYSGVSEGASDYERWRAETSVGNFEQMLSHAGGGDPVAGILQTEKSKVFLADPIYVSDEMMDLVEAASKTFVPEPLLPTDLICPTGFVLLPRSLSMIDVHQKRASYRAIAWMPAQTADGGKQGISMSLYSYGPDSCNPELDDYAEDYIGMDKQGILPAWGMLHTTAWMFEDAVPKHFTAEQGWWRDVQCLMRISMQYISTRERQQPSRHALKRTARAGIEEKYVTVVTLRRPRTKGDAPHGTVEWQNRWIVGGHWRNQWYPLANTHRQIWISPYIKGPEDKELKLRKLRVFEVVR